MEARVQAFTLVDGGQPAERTAQALAEFVAAAEHTLEIAIYDLRLPDPLAQTVRGALEGAAQRGVAVRLAYNKDCPATRPFRRRRGRSRTCSNRCPSRPRGSPACRT